ncbi:MAG: TIGR04348 family glycosyltransferase [Betaproteobacteria bacterium]|nr:TIGR04348 family glycosyltransferase [Betaproteobacteria bacterium]
MSHSLPVIAIVTPYLADANNGNWRTAHRWQTLLQDNFKTIVQNAWPLKPPQEVDAMIALHARRGADAIRQFRTQYPDKPLIVTLTGTDLYRDLHANADAQASIATANALVVLQDDAISHIPREYRHKTHVIYQSAKALRPAKKKAKGRLDCIVVGHLRGEKDPETIFRLAELIPDDCPLRILHIGAPLDEKFASRARELSACNRHYHWAGALPHGLTRAAIKRAHVLIHPSIMEGGANVIVEAISSGTPVIASRVSGNVGMLGHDYPGYFPVGDAEALWSLLSRCVSDSNLLSRLNTACAARAKLFSPETERASLCQMIDKLIAGSS